MNHEAVIKKNIRESLQIIKEYKAIKEKKEYYTEGTIIVLIGIALIIIKLI